MNIRYVFSGLLALFFAQMLFAQDHEVSMLTGIESELTITTNPNNPDEIIIASMGSGTPILVYKSSDAGSSWQQSAWSEGVADPVLCYGDNNTAYLTYLNFGNSLEMYLASSTDNGSSWDTEMLALDGMAADRQWIIRDNTPSSAYYGNTYLAYFHPEAGADIHIVAVDEEGNIGQNHSVQSTAYQFVQNPALDVDPAGNVLVCFLSQGADGAFQLVSTHSTDGSQSFSSESTVAPINMYNSNGVPISDVHGFATGGASRLQNSLQLAIDKSGGEHSGRAYLTWTDFAADNAMNVYLSYSDDLGANWSAPIVVNDDGVANSHQYYSGISVNPAGVLCLSWYDRRSDPGNNAMTDFYFAQSNDGGLSFQPSVKLTSQAADHTAINNGAVTFGVGEYTHLASTATHAYAVWSDGRENNGDMNVYFAKVALDGVSSVEEVVLAPALSVHAVYPNPIQNNKAVLDIELLEASTLKLSLSNMQGQRIQSLGEQYFGAGKHTWTIDLPILASGQYHLNIQHEKGVLHQSIIVAK